VTGPRVTVLGAGVVGAACARHLADGGARVRVRDPGAGRAAASWAAAGILSPSHPERLPPELHLLADRSRDLWEEVGRRHPEVELRRTGLVLRGDEPEWLAWRRARGLAVEEVAWPGPGGGAGPPAHRFPEVAVVRSPRVAPALLGDLPVDRGPVPPLEALRREADVVVIATGAWAAAHLAEAGLDLAVAPRRGQMLLFASGDLGTVLMEGAREGVAVPRADGRVVAGTTHEDTGFAAGTVTGDLDRLEEWARAAVPGLGAREDAWAGLRPWSPRAAPVVDVLAPGVVAAVGHFRNGILLAPATGELVADLVLGRAPRVDPAPFRAAR
jgi:glycine oxidase